MSTKYPEFFAALAAEFDRSEVKKLPKGGRQLDYVTARTVMNRFDEVAGPEGWWDKYVPGANSVMCELSLRLPGGEVVTKCDAGGYAGMADQGDDDKSGYSDAFKRAAAKWGVARYLYKDGTPDFTEHPAPAAKPAPAGATDGRGGKSGTNPSLMDWFVRKAVELGIHHNRLIHHVANVAEAEGHDDLGKIADPRAKVQYFAEKLRTAERDNWKAWLKAAVESYRAELAKSDTALGSN